MAEYGRFEEAAALHRRRKASQPAKGRNWLLTVPEVAVPRFLAALEEAIETGEVVRAEYQNSMDVATHAPVSNVASETSSVSSGPPAFSIWPKPVLRLLDPGEPEDLTPETSEAEEACEVNEQLFEEVPEIVEFQHRHAVVNVSLPRALSWMRRTFGMDIHYEICRNLTRARYYLRKNCRIGITEVAPPGCEFRRLPASFAGTSTPPCHLASVSSDLDKLSVNDHDDDDETLPLLDGGVSRGAEDKRCYSMSWPQIVRTAMDLDTLAECEDYLREADPFRFVNSYGRLASGLAKHFARKAATTTRPIRAGVRRRTPITAEMFDLQKSAELHVAWSKVCAAQKVLWLWGGTGLGKTKWVETNVDCALRCNNWDSLKRFSIVDHEVLWFDDMDWSLTANRGKFSRDDLKVLFGSMDEERDLHQRYSNVTIPANALKGIIVTSNNPPMYYFGLDDELQFDSYGGNEAGCPPPAYYDWKALQRRINVVHIRSKLF